MRLDSIHVLIRDMVRTLYSAECQLVIALPRVAARVYSESLRSVLQEHLEQTRLHVTRLEEVGDMLNVSVGGGRSLAMQGLLKDSDEAMGYGGDPILIDHAIVASAQAVEQYEIVTYRALRRFIATEGHVDVLKLLDATIAEELEACHHVSRPFKGVAEVARVPADQPQGATRA